MLEVPRDKILPTLDGRAFCYESPKLWNNLPGEISSLDSLSNFKCHVKTYLLNKLLICRRIFISLILLFIIYYHFISFEIFLSACKFYSF